MGRESAYFLLFNSSFLSSRIIGSSVTQYLIDYGSPLGSLENRAELLRSCLESASETPTRDGIIDR